MKQKGILYFDGVCNLCNSAIDFFITRDKKRILQYAPLQGISANENLGKPFTEDLNTVVLYLDGKIYTKSRAIIYSLQLLGFPYGLFIIFIILPKFVTDIAYDFIAKNRYRFFGKKETCRIPSPEERSLFFD